MKSNKHRLAFVLLLIVGFLCLVLALGVVAGFVFASRGADVGIIGGADAPTFLLLFLRGADGVPVILSVGAIMSFVAAIALRLTGKR